MVETQLTPELMKEGAALIAKLDTVGFSPDAALWIYSPDTGRWRLLLAERKLASSGPREIYRAVQKALTAMRSEIVHLSLDDVSVAMPSAPIVQSLRQVIVTVPGAGGIRFPRNVINGTMVEDAYIYRLQRPAA